MIIEERLELRGLLVRAYMAVQNEYEDRDADELMPEMVAALASLTVFIGRMSGLSHDDLRKLMEDEWLALPSEPNERPDDGDGVERERGQPHIVRRRQREPRKADRP